LITPPQTGLLPQDVPEPEYQSDHYDMGYPPS
jgi:hypothetical protein